MEDYSHLLLNREDEHRDGNDQGSLAFADFNAIKIGRALLKTTQSLMAYLSMSFISAIC